MEIIKEPIINAIKAIGSSKIRGEEQFVYKFIKKEMQSITNEQIKATLKILRALGIIDNKQSNDKCSYFLIDNINKDLRIVMVIAQIH